MILVVGLSSVWQRTLWFDGLKLGEVNRARRVLETSSGKGVNVARILGQLGVAARVLTVAGGARGRNFRAGLKHDGVAARVVSVDGQTRICQTVIVRPPKTKQSRGAPQVTELVEESAPLSRREVQAVWRAFEQALSRTQMLVLSGTVPRGCGDDFYARLARAARRRGIPVVIDAQGVQLMQAVEERPRLVKINCQELLAATRKHSLAAGVDALRKRGAEAVVITQGGRAAIGFAGRQRWRATPPRVEVVNPIGSGDAMLAGMAASLVGGEDLREALRWGVACGAANALSETSGVIQAATVRRLLRHQVF